VTLQALIFDVDGTLADTEETHREAFNYAFLRFGLGWEWSRALYRQLLATSGGKERIARYVATLPLPEAERTRLLGIVPAIHREKTELYAELIGDGRCPLRPGVQRLIEEARSAGLQLAIASTTTTENAHALLCRHLGAGAMRIFAAVACGDLVPKKKPAPDVYRLVLSTLGRSAERCVAFEDSANGLRSAKAAELFTVVTPTQWTVGEDFGRADLELAHLGEPRRELAPEEAARIGAPWLGVAQLVELHAATRGRALVAGGRR